MTWPWEELPREVREKYLRGALLMSRVYRVGVAHDYSKRALPASTGDNALESSGQARERVAEWWDKELDRREAAKDVEEAVGEAQRILRPTRAFEKAKR